jgi:hypothetical protein
MPPLFFEISDPVERKRVLSKFTKSNVKIPRFLDPDQLAGICGFLIDRTLELIQVTFSSDFGKL